MTTVLILHLTTVSIFQDEKPQRGEMQVDRTFVSMKSKKRFGKKQPVVEAKRKVRKATISGSTVSPSKGSKGDKVNSTLFSFCLCWFYCFLGSISKLTILVSDAIGQKEQAAQGKQDKVAQGKQEKVRKEEHQ